ncbi:MAG: hypothetical protein CBB87_07630 [Micavibrio sp. TMED27]|nr:hypothetical protein [Micavibrio sp.]OUT90541.1 MAG: hypothetical protein CBB87_07630 [Micavibrio sp. TMED27]|tara:strand:+ start:138 stop:923 length:786 start_codon:yes stop_codon:yes gene_type:complete
MRILTQSILAICALSISACAGVQPQNGKLHPKYTEYTKLPMEVKVTENRFEKPLSVKIPVTNLHAGGGSLIGLLAVTAVNLASTGVSYAKRADEKDAILGSIKNVSMYNDPAKEYKKTISGAEWLDVKGHEVLAFSDNRKEVRAVLIAEMNNKAYVEFGSVYQIGEEFENLTQYFNMKVYTVKDNRIDKEVYSASLSDVYYPEESMDEGFENHTLWIENNNAHIKRAIKETTQNINQQLKEFLEDPYMPVEEEKEADREES